VTVPAGYSAYVERTVLAWRRTGLALFILAVMAAKAADIGHVALVTVLGVVVALSSLAVVLVAERRAARQRSASTWALLTTTTGLCVAVAVVGGLLALAA
jgi:hypothetical protein